MESPIDQKLMECLVSSHAQSAIVTMYLNAMLDEFLPGARERVIAKVRKMAEASTPEVRQLLPGMLSTAGVSRPDHGLKLILGGLADDQLVEPNT